MQKDSVDGDQGKENRITRITERKRGKGHAYTLVITKGKIRKTSGEEYKKHYIRKKKILEYLNHQQARKLSLKQIPVPVNWKCDFLFNRTSGIAFKQRYRRALRKACRDISELQNWCVELQKGEKTLQKRLERELFALLRQVPPLKLHTVLLDKRLMLDRQILNWTNGQTYIRDLCLEIQY